MLLPSAEHAMAKLKDNDFWVNNQRCHRMSFWIMSIFVKWKFYELTFWTAPFQQLWAPGILSSHFLVKWVQDVGI